MDTIHLLVIGEPGPLRDGLQALLWTIPTVKKIIWVEDLSEAAETYMAFTPALVFVDHPVSVEESNMTLEKIHDYWPQTPCIVLVSDNQQQQAIEFSGADAVLLEGMLAAKLVATVEDALVKRGQRNDLWLEDIKPNVEVYDV
jgi:DNA-binding NarL/FixJ family response regulator